MTVAFVTPNAGERTAGRRPIRDAANHAAKKFQRITEKYNPINGSVQKPLIIFAKPVQAS